jgi:hypothetical protein
MTFQTTDVNRFDVYFAQDLTDALNAAAVIAKHTNLDELTVAQLLGYLARRWHLVEVAP